MILQLDIGNSALKWRLCGSGCGLQRGTIARGGAIELPIVDPAPQAVWIASVAGQAYEAALGSTIAERWGVEPWFARSSAAACGVTNSYASPERLGVDRWLAMIAAWQQAHCAVCVVDAGSALTIDFLDGRGVHTGGYILPGVTMMEVALREGTDRVRFGDAPRDCLAPGRSTESAVLNGLQLAQVGAVELALTRFGQGETLVFTGGNGNTLMRLLNRGGTFQEDLVLEGLGHLGAASEAAGVSTSE
jgi:type III pantothenate kinase